MYNLISYCVNTKEQTIKQYIKYTIYTGLHSPT